jgi:osmotically-inducible protein OsmY
MKTFNRIAVLFLLALTFASLFGCAASSTNEGTKAYLDDSVVTTKVKTAILGEPSLNSYEIGVETYKGTVQLSGFVSSKAEVSKAGEVTRGVDGVLSVKNDIQLKEQL